MVTCSDDTGDQGHGDDDIQPFLDDLAVHAGSLDQDEGQDGAKDQFPNTFYPQMHYPPPVVLVHDKIGGVVECKQEEYGKAGQTHQQHQVHDSLTTLEDGHADVEQERQGDDDDAYLGDSGLFQELSTHGGQQVVHGQFCQGGIRHQQIAKNGGSTGDQEDPEHQICEPGGKQFCFCFFRNQIVGRSHKAEQQPYDKQVGVHHTCHVEGDLREQEVPDNILGAHDQAEQYLSHKESDCRDKIQLGNLL